MSITINLTKAKDIAKDNLRTERAPVLAALDVQFMRAVIVGVSVSMFTGDRSNVTFP